VICWNVACDTNREEDPPTTSTIGIEFVRIPAGTFTMGSESGQSVSQPAHSVTISRDYFLSRYEITQSQYSALKTNRSFHRVTGGDEVGRPVEMVTWLDAIEYANTLSVNEDLDPCFDNVGNVIGVNLYACEGYRLPSEAEWEYACRAGSTGDYYFNGDIATQLPLHAWFDINSDQVTHPAGQKQPNAWKLYDLYGNVTEWVYDFYNRYYYATSPPVDPQGPDLKTSTRRVIRGGSYFSSWIEMSSRHRYSVESDTPGMNIGFRLAKTIQTNSPE